MTDKLKNWTDRYKSPAFWLATGFGSGLLPKAPGTWGSLAASLLIIPALYRDNAFEIIVGLSFIAFALGIYAASVWEKHTKTHDDGRIVIDEFAGQWIAVLPITYLDTLDMLPIALFAAFGLFRIFDVLKPYPICWLDKNIHGSLGVMVDDVVAGIFAAMVLYFILPVIL